MDEEKEREAAEEEIQIHEPEKKKKSKKDKEKKESKEEESKPRSGKSAHSGGSKWANNSGSGSATLVLDILDTAGQEEYRLLILL